VLGHSNVIVENSKYNFILFEMYISLV